MGLASAAANSAAVAKRSAGSFSSAVRTAPSTCGGMVCRCAVSERGRLGHDARDDGLRRGPHERRLAAEHLVEDAAERVDVGARADLALAHRLLGAHVVRRAERHARLGHAGAARLAGGERDAEVGHEGGAVVEQDVLGLDVAVDDVVPVRVVQGGGHLARDPHRVGHRQLLLPVHPVADGLAFDVRHDVEEEAVGLAAVEERQDVRVLEVGGGGDLAQEPLGADDRGQLRPEHLDRHLAVVLEVLRQVDGGHAAGAEFLLEAVAVGEGLGEAGKRVRQGETPDR